MSLPDPTPAELFLCGMNRVVAQLDSDIAVLAGRYPWAFPKCADSTAALADISHESVQRIKSIPARSSSINGSDSKDMRSASSAAAVRAALQDLEATTGLSLLSYAPPSAAIASNGDTQENDGDGLGSDIDATLLTLSAKGANRELSNASAASVSLPPLTAALLASARRAPTMVPANLTRTQVQDVLFLRQQESRHGAAVDSTHARLTRLVDQWESLLDRPQAICDQVAAFLHTYSAGCAQTLAVSGDAETERKVWQRWTVSANEENRSSSNNSGGATKTIGQIIELSMVNKRRLQGLLARWTSLKTRYARVVEEANTRTCAVMLQLDEWEAMEAKRKAAPQE